MRNIYFTLGAMSMDAGATQAFNTNFPNLRLISGNVIRSHTDDTVIGPLQVKQIKEAVYGIEDRLLFMVYNKTQAICVLEGGVSTFLDTNDPGEVDVRHIDLHKSTLSRLQKMAYDDIGSKINHSRKAHSQRGDVLTLDQLVSKYGRL